MTSILNISITEYSEKSFVVRGDTEKHKEALIMLGGKWNPRLRDGSGWIFPNTKKDEVKKWQRTGNTPTLENRASFYNNTQQQYTNSSSSYETRDLYSEINKMNNKIDNLEKLILKLLQKDNNEEDAKENVILANSSDDEEYEEEKVPMKRLLGRR